MGWWQDFVGDISDAYSGIKETVSNIYHPVKSFVHGVADTLKDIDKFISKGKDIPIVRDIVGVIQGNPLYAEVMSTSQDFADAVDYAGELGNIIDTSISSGLKAASEMAM
jgi:hypothetical protein